MFAPGIESKKVLSDTSQIPEKKVVPFVIQEHHAKRAGKHYDIRIGDGKGGLHSFATRRLPNPGEKVLVVLQPLHSEPYQHFEGEIKEGYGAGTVKTHEKGTALITKNKDNILSFTLAHKQNPERYSIINNSLLLNTTPMSGEKLIGKEPTKLKIKKSDESILTKPLIFQEKIDGASLLYKIKKDKIEAVSTRKSVSGRPIVHTERTIEQPKSIDPKLVGTILRGEVYGTRNGKVIPVQELSGALNSSLDKALKSKIKFHHAIFDIDSNQSRSDKINSIKNAIKGIKNFHVPKTSTNGIKLLEDIKGNLNKRTKEGVVAWDGDQGYKVKLTPESDVYVHSFFPAEGKYKDKAIGGFYYSLEKNGKPVGKVGSGFSDKLRMDMFNNPDDYLNRIAKIKSMGKYPSGAHRAPSLINIHEDY